MQKRLVKEKTVDKEKTKTDVELKTRPPQVQINQSPLHISAPAPPTVFRVSIKWTIPNKYESVRNLVENGLLQVNTSL